MVCTKDKMRNCPGCCQLTQPKVFNTVGQPEVRECVDLKVSILSHPHKPVGGTDLLLPLLPPVILALLLACLRVKGLWGVKHRDVSIAVEHFVLVIQLLLNVCIRPEELRILLTILRVLHGEEARHITVRTDGLQRRPLRTAKTRGKDYIRRIKIRGRIKI